MELICIVCPRGCLLEVYESQQTEGGAISVSGNQCPKGIEFARQEWYHPTRLITTTVRVNSSKYPRLSVKTSQNVDKHRIFDIMEALESVKVNLPIAMGDIIVENILDLGVNIVATQTLKED